ncbi:alpha/beta hydrolase-fold protein [Sporomusa malonica]|uniref:Alpha/beta hydrolase family protein n=1 Tax=Sporomusa malonica TaxID=112901 RepID=A0A1W2F1K9_9FIRM|nr:PHB depolymerase family esterase [Sporomusa malonica]SMD15784.1 Alpha/beta hydrolase family protein [Sporomusa malonica]
MKKIFVIIIFLLFIITCYCVQKGFNANEQKGVNIEPSLTLAEHTSETSESSTTFVEKRNTFTYNDHKIQYMLIFPAGYAQTTNHWPMILFLHGSSLRGQNIDLVKEYGPTWVAERRTDFPFIVLAPQCPEDETWLNKSDVLAALLDDVFTKYRIDEDRVYLTGTSMGGNGTWNLACQHPEYFAAIAPLASNPTVPNSWNKQLISMPIWAFHGEKDTICPMKNDEEMINALLAQGSRPKFTVLQDQGHNIAGVYKNQELYDWFLTYTRHH